MILDITVFDRALIAIKIHTYHQSMNTSMFESQPKAVSSSGQKDIYVLGRINQIAVLNLTVKQSVTSFLLTGVTFPFLSRQRLSFENPQWDSNDRSFINCRFPGWTSFHSRFVISILLLKWQTSIRAVWLAIIEETSGGDRLLWSEYGCEWQQGFRAALRISNVIANRLPAIWCSISFLH